ncbi:MAG: hypothetical protein WDW38_004664 [Sanguina aurantia]
MLEMLFGKRKTPDELLRENKRQLDKAIRDLDRERMGLQNQEKKVVAEIKKMAKEGQTASVQVMAKSLIRNRHAVTKMYGLKSQLQSVSLRLAAMRAMSQNLKLPALQKIMRDFERQNEKMEMTSDMMGDAVDDALEGEGEAEETDELVQQVLDEIGITNMMEMAHAPGAKPVAQRQAAPAMGAAAEGGSGLDDELQARLDNLRKQ